MKIRTKRAPPKGCELTVSFFVVSKYLRLRWDLSSSTGGFLLFDEQVASNTGNLTQDGERVESA